MTKLKRYFMLAAALYLAITLAGLGGMFGNALASTSIPLTLTNAKGELLTVGSVSVTNDGTNLSISFNTDPEYKLFFTEANFRGNSGGITRVMSTGRTEHLVNKTDNDHSYLVSLSEIKKEGVTIFLAADVIVNGAVTNTKKAYVNIETEIPPTTTSTNPPSTTTSTNLPSTTTSANPPSTTTSTIVNPPTDSTLPPSSGTTVTTVSDSGGGGNIPTTSTTINPTSTTVQPTSTTENPTPITEAPTDTTGRTTTTSTRGNITTTTELANDTTSGGQVTTTTVLKLERERLPFTGMGHNWYLIGIMLALAGTGIYLGSEQKRN